MIIYYDKKSQINEISGELHNIFVMKAYTQKIKVMSTVCDVMIDMGCKLSELFFILLLFFKKFLLLKISE